MAGYGCHVIHEIHELYQYNALMNARLQSGRDGGTTRGALGGSRVCDGVTAADTMTRHGKQ